MPSQKNVQIVVSYGVLFGAIGGAIAGASAAKKRFLYVLDLNSGTIHPLTQNYMQQLLKDKNEALWEVYSNLPEQGSEFVLLYYIDLLNASLSSATTIQPSDNLD